MSSFACDYDRRSVPDAPMDVQDHRRAIAALKRQQANAYRADRYWQDLQSQIEHHRSEILRKL